MSFKMGRLFVFLVVFYFTLTACFGQSSLSWMDKYYVNTLKTMKIDYNRPSGFDEISGKECFDSIPALKDLISCVSNQLHSNDGQFIAFIPVYHPLTKKDSIDISRMFPDSVFPGVNRIHEPLAEAGIKLSLGEAAAKNWRRYVNYYPQKDAVSKFNADTALSYSIKLDSQEYYKNKFNHLKVLILQKRDRGYINFYCFYTDKAQPNFSKYWKAIEGVFRYRD